MSQYFLSRIHSSRGTTLVAGLAVFLLIAQRLPSQEIEQSPTPQLVSQLRENLVTWDRVACNYEMTGSVNLGENDSMIDFSIEKGSLFRDGEEFRLKFCFVYRPSNSNALSYWNAEACECRPDGVPGMLYIESVGQFEVPDISLDQNAWALPEFDRARKDSTEVQYQFWATRQFHEYLSVFTGEIYDIGHVADFFQSASDTRETTAEFQGMPCHVIEGSHEGKQCRVTICPQLDWMIVKAEGTIGESNGKPGRRFEKLVHHVSDDRSEIKLSLTVDYDRPYYYGGTRLCREFRFFNIAHGLAIEPAWVPQSIPEDTLVEVYRSPGIPPLIWHEGQLQKR